MTSSRFSRVVRRPALWATAALLLNTGAALAADDIGDGQAQARAFLAGHAPVAHARATTARTEGSASAPWVDPQEQARQLILGAQGASHVPAQQRIAKAQAARDAGAARRANPQALAQRMILGAAG